MSAVALYHQLYVALPPLVEVTVIVVPAALVESPAVERLVHHYYSHLVAQLHQKLGGWIVSDSQRVETCVAEFFELASARRGIVSRSEHSVVVVYTASAELHGDSVYKQSVLGVGGDCAHTESYLLGVKCVAAFGDSGAERVEIGVFDIPESGVGERYFSGYQGLAARGDVLVERSDRVSLGVEYVEADDDIGRAVSRDLAEDLHGVGVGSVDPESPGLYADVSALVEPYIAVDSRSGVPSCRGLAVVGSYGELVLLTELNAGSQVDEERRVAVRVLRDEIVPETYAGVHVSAVDVEYVVFRLGGNVELLYVSTLSADKEAVGSSSGSVGSSRLSHRVIVGKIDGLPAVCSRRVERPSF